MESRRTPNRVAPVMVKSGATEPISGVGDAGAAGCCARSASGASRSAETTDSAAMREDIRRCITAPGVEVREDKDQTLTSAIAVARARPIQDRGQSAVPGRDRDLG